MAFASMWKGAYAQGDLTRTGAEHFTAGLDEISQIEFAVEELQVFCADIIRAQK